MIVWECQNSSRGDFSRYQPGVQTWWILYIAIYCTSYITQSGVSHIYILTGLTIQLRVALSQITCSTSKALLLVDLSNDRLLSPFRLVKQSTSSKYKSLRKQFDYEVFWRHYNSIAMLWKRSLSTTTIRAQLHWSRILDLMITLSILKSTITSIKRRLLIRSWLLNILSLINK